MQATHSVSSIIPSSRGAVLEVLVRTTTPLSARAVAALTDGRVSHTQANSVLKSLADAGVVVSESRPPANLHTLNHRHVAADAVVALVSMRTELFERMRATVGRWTPMPHAVWVFGSFARGDATNESDIDVLVVRPDDVDTDALPWHEQIMQLEQDVSDWSGNDCNVVEFSQGEFAGLVAEGGRLPADVARDGIRLFGDPLPRAAIRRRRP